MNNKLFNLFRSKIKINVLGKNIKRFINKLIFNNIELLNINYLSNDQVHVVIYKKDYKKVLELKSIYDFEIIDSYGYIKIKKKIGVDKFIILFLILGIISIYVLSNIIFSIEFIHTDKELISLFKKDLTNYDIEPFKFKKSFKEISNIKKEILNRHKDKLEWLEIENIGTKYVIRFEERKIINVKEDTSIQHVIAKKNAIIKKIVAKSGVIIKPKNSYVKKGDIVISGEIKLNEETKNFTHADGKVYGEVWYNVTTSFPYLYIEKNYTGKKKKLILLKIFNDYYGLNFKKYNYSDIKDINLIKNNILPISLVFQESREVIDNSVILTKEEANIKAIEKSRKKIEEMLDDEEYIIYEKQLKKEVKDSKIVIEMFYAVFEDITDYLSIDVGG